MPRRTPPGKTNMKRGPVSDLHFAASSDSVKRTSILLSSGKFDINKGDPAGYTPLMVAADQGSSRVAKVLVERGADVSIVGDNGLSALFISAQEGHLAITKMLVKAGAPLETRTVAGSTPLFVAARRGHSEVVRVLIAAGAKVDGFAVGESSLLGPTTPLFVATARGHLHIVRQLLSAGASALLTARHRGSESSAHVTYEPQQQEYLPLDISAECGHTAVVRELIEQRGIEGCGGPSGGRDALRLAAKSNHLDAVAALTSAGVVDGGRALCIATCCGQEAIVKFLLRQRRGDKKPSDVGGVAYANAPDLDGRTPLLSSISLCRSPRIVRMLIDDGADTTSAVCVRNNMGIVVLDQTPMAFTLLSLHKQKVMGSKATKEQLQTLEAIRRLLLQVDAVRAVSWLWSGGDDVHSAANAAGAAAAAAGTAVKRAAESGRNLKEASAQQQLAMMVPIMRRRARKQGVLLCAMLRYSRKS